MNIQQQRLAKELERTRRRMKEEVVKVKTTTKRLRKTLGQGAQSDDDEQVSIDSFAKQLGIDLEGLEEVKKAAGVSVARRRSTCAVRDDGTGGSMSSKGSKSKKKRKAKDGPVAGMHTLPILTTDGRGAFEVNAGMNSSGMPTSGMIPVFALPSVNQRSVEFVNRIPREPKPEEIAAREKEKEEMLLMQQHLGLTEADLRDLEEELGMRKGERASSNEVDKFLQQQLSQGAGSGVDGGAELPTLNLDTVRSTRRKKAKRSRNIWGGEEEEEGEEDESDIVLNRSTPRCLSLGVKSTTNELRNELGTR